MPQNTVLASTNDSPRRHGQGFGLDPDRTRASSVTSSIGSSDPTSLAEQMVMSNMAERMGLGLTTPPYSSTFPAYAMDMDTQQQGWPQQMQDLPRSTPEAFSEAYSSTLSQASHGAMVDMIPRSVRTMSAPPVGEQADFSGMSSSPGSSGWPSTPFWQHQQHQQQQQSVSMGGGHPDFVGTYGPPDDGTFLSRSHSQMSMDMPMTLAEEQQAAAALSATMAWSMAPEQADLMAQVPAFTQQQQHQHHIHHPHQSYPLLAGQQGW